MTQTDDKNKDDESECNLMDKGDIKL